MHEHANMPHTIRDARFTPARAGIGLRFAHYDAIRAQRPDVGFLEVHTENFFGGGYHLDMLSDLAADYPISLHCIGLSLGSCEPVDGAHLAQVKSLAERFRPVLISDHASWSRSGNAHLPDLLPLPYTQETLQALSDNVQRVQDALGRAILVENPSTYLRYAESAMDEAVFLRRLCERSGCGLLLDVNNIVVQAHNNGLDALAYLDALAGCEIGEIHLAGHIEQVFDSGASLLIDTHSRPVPDAVWALYDAALARFGPVATLIEWDKDIPVPEVLLAEADKANQRLAEHHSPHLTSPRRRGEAQRRKTSSPERGQGTGRRKARAGLYAMG